MWYAAALASAVGASDAVRSLKSRNPGRLRLTMAKLQLDIVRTIMITHPARLRQVEGCTTCRPLTMYDDCTSSEPGE